MIFKDYLKGLQDLIDKNPECLNYKVVYAIDEEGNSFDEVYFEPSLGYHENSEFIADFNFDDYESDKEIKINSICIN